MTAAVTAVLLLLQLLFARPRTTAAAACAHIDIMQNENTPLGFRVLAPDHHLDGVTPHFGVGYDETDLTHELTHKEHKVAGVGGGLGSWRIELVGDCYIPGLDESKDAVEAELTTLCQVPLAAGSSWPAPPADAVVKLFLGSARDFLATNMVLRLSANWHSS
jgi:hypothetical protein